MARHKKSLPRRPFDRFHRRNRREHQAPPGENLGPTRPNTRAARNLWLAKPVNHRSHQLVADFVPHSCRRDQRRPSRPFPRVFRKAHPTTHADCLGRGAVSSLQMGGRACRIHQGTPLDRALAGVCPKTLSSGILLGPPQGAGNRQPSGQSSMATLSSCDSGDENNASPPEDHTRMLRPSRTLARIVTLLCKAQ